MIRFNETVATSTATADIAYCVFVICSFVTGGLLIYLLWQKIESPKAKAKRQPAKAVKRTTSKPVTKKAAAKKPVRKTTKKK